MDYREFKEELARMVGEELGENIRIHFEPIQKNNGITVEGMVFTPDNPGASPVMYVEEYYRLWKKGVPMEELVRKMVWHYEKNRNRIPLDPKMLDDYENVKNQIYFQLIHYEKNKKRLEDVPHRRVLDLAMVFYYRLEYQGARATLLIREQNLKRWGITAGMLEDYACRITPKKLPACLMTMAELLGVQETGEDGGMLGNRFPMYVLTNTDRSLGAAAILYPGFLKNHTDVLGDEFFILPSSIHECILVPGWTGYRQEALAGMVKEINRKHVDPREVLSDRVYCYRKNSDGIFL